MSRQPLLARVAKGHCGCPGHLSNSPVTKAALKTVSWENKMIELHKRIADDPEYHICRFLLQFEKYGAVIIYEAYILEDLGYLTSADHKIRPFSDLVKLYQMTPEAKKELPKFRDDWVNIYVQKYKLPSNDIVDIYSSKDADDYFWGLSKKRLNQERNRGRIGKAMRRTL